VSFIVASLGSGLIIGRLGPQTVLPLLVGGAALMVVGAHLVPHALARASDVVSALRRLSLSDAFKLLRAPVSAVLACSEPDPIEPRPLLQLRQSQLAGARHL
jgi:hypothetical protein